MKCPIDGSELTKKQKDNIIIQSCPKCNGVWLDRGEINKIIAKSEIEYPDIEDFKGGLSARERKYQSPGSFLGGLFEH